jgi:tetratricopeptide (TPR) repeat protein
MNPQMFEQAKKNMSHGDAKTAATRIATMSDQELKEYAKMAGMPGMTPEMMRMSAQMMSGMDQSQFNQYKNMAGNMPFPGADGGFPGGGTPTAGSTSQSTPSFNKSQSAAAPETQKSSSNFSKIEGLKTKGNDYFKNGDMDSAGSAYFEAILEIEELRIKNPKFDSTELTTLEVSCRLNYTTVKSKTSEWDICMEQAQKALKHGENGKALFRLGQAQYHQGKKKDAVGNLRRASQLLTTDGSVKELLDKCEAELNSSPTKQEAKTSTSPQEKPKDSREQKSTTEETSQPSSSGQSKLKKKAAAEAFDPENETHHHKKTSAPKDSYNIYEDAQRSSTSDASPERSSKQSNKKPDVVIEEERKEPYRQPQESRPSANSNEVAGGIDADKINQAKEGLKNMSPDQMKMATDFMRNADPSFIKQMMKQQTGMEMSDEQINMMKGMMTPEMLQFAAKNPDLAGMAGGAGLGGNTGGSGSRPSTGGNQAPSTMPAGFPNFGGGGTPDLGSLMNNPDMINNMMKSLTKNPEMLKGMSKMLGENNPLSKLLENRSPEEIEKMMGSMQKIFGVFQKVSPALSFIRKYWKHMLVLFVAFLVYRYAL